MSLNPGSQAQGHHTVLPVKMEHSGNFPGGPVIKTLSFYCRGPRFDPGPGMKILHAAEKKTRGTFSCQRDVCIDTYIFPDAMDQERKQLMLRVS